MAYWRQSVVYGDTIIQRQQRTSLLVVLGNGPVYQPALDRRVRQARVFSSPDVQVYSRSLATLPPAGAANYVIDVFRQTQAKFFAPDDTFLQQQKGTRLVTDFNSDIFSGNDTYGWPPDDVPIYWSPEGRGTFNLLQSFVPYNPATDTTNRRGNAQYFGIYDEFFKFQQPITINAITFTYVPRNDVVSFAKQQKYFEQYQEFFKASQPITANALNFFPVYNPATDPIFRRPQQKFFGEYQEFSKGQGITGNALIFFPVYNPSTDVTRFPRPIKFFDDVQIFIDRTLPPNLNLLGSGGIPTPPPPGFIVMPNYVGMDWYVASLQIAQAGFDQVFPPIIVKRGAPFVNYEVVAQVPAAGTFVVPGSNLQLTVTFGYLLAPTFDLTV